MKRYLNEQSPNVKWDLGANLGNPFENYVANLIVQQLKQFHPNVKVTQTVSVGDGGKDIVVVSYVDSIEIFGQKFYLSGKDNIKIFFECKSTNDDLLRFDKVVSSYIRSKDQDIDYYVLVTNSCILPKTHCLITEELALKNIKFMLIDGFILGKYISKTDNPTALGNPYFDSPSLDFYYEYQVEPYGPQPCANYDLYFLFRNYTDANKHCTLQLKTDVDWSVLEDQTSFIIAPMGSVVKKVRVKQNYYDGIPELLFKVQVNDMEAAIMINGIKGDRIFDPPFIGEDRKSILKKLIEDLKSPKAPNIICFWGDAGIGKTRLKDELIKQLAGTFFDISECKLQKGHNPSEKIQEYFKSKGYLDNKSYDDFSTTIQNCSKDGWRAIFFIDDFHNASQEFINQIKKLKNSSAPVTFILCGRTDFSIGDLSFMSFVRWTKDNFPEYSFDIQPLEDEETKSLIRILIEGIPEYALNRLYELSMNNPLYVVQYIEYLLDINLVKLINRNTVGIVDINKFKSKKYIPQKITEIYKLRIASLLKQNNGQECLDFLYKIALCNGIINKDICYKFFESDNRNWEELVERRLLKYDSNENITFVHESLFLYISSCLDHNKSKRKIIANEILAKKKLDLLLNSFQIGRLGIFAENYPLAEKLFEPIISWLKIVKNYSNNNVDISFYDYLFDMFELARHKNRIISIAKKAILMRVYITLHHYVPINAVSECDFVIEKIVRYKSLSDEAFRLSIMELKAHALMNSGLYTDGETLLKEIQAYWLTDSRIIVNETLFDLYDRLSSVYRHFNLKELAEKYNSLSMNLAENLNDDKLKMLANRTRFKTCLYSNMKLALNSLQETANLNKNSPTDRIKTDNDLDICGFEILYNPTPNWDQLISTLNSLCEYAEKNEFNRARIHGYFLLAICNLQKGEKESIFLAKDYTEKAINCSTSFGIVGYMWRLHNLYAIIKMRLDFDEGDIYKTFCTVFEILEKRGLLYIGNRDLCHGNILALSNFGYYLEEHQFESFFYEKMSQITYTNKHKGAMYKKNNQAIPVNDFLVQQYRLAKDKKILFTDQQPQCVLRDSQTKYIIVL